MSTLSLTLTELLIFIGIVAILLTLIVEFVFKKKKSWLMTYLQNFVGSLLVVSGIVKAVDPLGTAYKMTDYLGEFQYTAEGSFLSPIAGLFPFLNNYVVALAVIMIIFEIVLGIMLIIGHRPKFTAWSYLVLMVVFTIMTGFTYLTGYVPEGVNFFEFSKWGPYLASNMKVTDCGCFGDFIKLEPFVTFSKDVVLLIPGLFFLLRSKTQHQLFTRNTRDIIAIVSAFGLLIYSFSNYVWDIPKVDFRPFKKDVNILAVKEQEETAMANVAILAWKLKNKESGEVTTLANADYMKSYKDYPKAKWEIIDQIKTKPAIKSSKISEMELTEPIDGGDVHEEVLSNPDENFLIVCYKLKGEAISKERVVKDSSFVEEIIKLKDDRDSTISNFAGIVEKTETYMDYNWDQDYIDAFTSKIKPLVEQAAAEGKKVSLAAGSDADMINSLLAKTGISMDFYTADNILLKTIVRSNPGILLMKNSTILDKWHYKQLPEYNEIKTKYNF